MTASRFAALLTLAATLAAAPLAVAQVTVADPWVRAVVAGQMATGAFMRLTAATDAALVDAASPIARIVEIHEMKMEGGVMTMSAVDRLPLPAGKAVDLKPGGYHVMLMDLKAPLAAGASIDLNLVVEGKDGKRETLALKAPVRALGAAPPAAKDAQKY